MTTFYVRRFSPLFRAKHCFSGSEEKHITPTLKVKWSIPYYWITNTQYIK